MVRILIAICLSGAALWAQSFTASVTGTVTDSTGGVIPQATIVAVNTATNGRTMARTDAAGNYTILQLSPGTTRWKYRRPVSKNYLAKVGGTGSAAAGRASKSVLTRGRVSENGDRDENASRLETVSSTVGKVVDNRAILNLPLNTRNVYSLIYLTPGVGGSIGNNYNSLSYSINGARASLMETMVDGVTGGHPTVQGYSGISVFPSVDAIDEFKVMGADYSAEFGRSLGSIVNVVFKSGTNQWHGAAYEFLRNSVLDANDFFANSRGAETRQLQAQPVRRLIERSRSARIRRSSSFPSKTCASAISVPLADRAHPVQRQGDFSQTFAANGQQIRIFDPFTTRENPAGGFIRDQFPGNIIPANRILAVSRNIVNYFPLPTGTGNTVTNAQNYYHAGSHSLNLNNYAFRFDHNIMTRKSSSFATPIATTKTCRRCSSPPTSRLAEGRIIQQDYMRNFVGSYTNTLSPIRS